MGVKGRVMELLRSDDAAGLEHMVRAEPRAVRHLLGRLWDTEPLMRRRAAVALGAAAAAHPELGRDLVRRLLWGLNDESATNGVYGLAALGEIGYRAPELIGPFVGPMASYAWDDGLRPELLRALARIAESAPEAVAATTQILERHTDMSNPQEQPFLEQLLLIAGEEGSDA